MEGKLPKGWKLEELKKVVFFQEGPGLRKFQYRESGIPFLNIRTISNGKVDRSQCQFLDEQEVYEKYKHFLLEENDIICSTSGTIGKTAIITRENLPLMLNTSIIRFRPLNDKLVTRNFILYFLKSSWFFEQANQFSTGTAQKNLGPSHLNKFNFPLPPSSEQERIVAKLDQLFAHLETAKKGLEKIPTLLKEFRQSVLTQAVTGKLTEEWREGKELGEWEYKKASDCCFKVQSGGTPKLDGFDNNGIPFLKVYNIVNNSIDFDYRPQYITEFAHNSSGKKSIGYPGDVIMNIVGPPMNKIAILPDTYPQWNFNQAITT
jgi:type I restriction enzyme S subunit